MSSVRFEAGAGRWLSGLAGLLLFVLTGALATAASAQQQNGTIGGRVTDASSGAPLSDVQIFIAGSGLGGLSRADGRFLLLNVPVGAHEIRAERIGLASATQQVTVTAGATAQVDFTLGTQALGLDEIVVTGTAGASRRREVGNSITQINVVELPERPTDVSDMLLSSAPGVEVNVGGGETGQGSAIRLRGVNSVNNSAQPIIYIDGVRMMSGNFEMTTTPDYSGGRGANNTPSPLDMLNPNDIERIEIIKGSAASTLYGTEASAGVIQVFTKRGSQGAPVWTLETQQGTMWSQRFGQGGWTNQWGGESDYLFMNTWICTGLMKCGELGHQAWTSQYSASVRGGGQNLQYFVSGEFQDEAGNLPNDFLDKWSVRGNFTFSPLSDLQLQWNTSYTNQAQTNTPVGNNSQGITLNAFRQNQNYYGTGDPALIDELMDWEIAQAIERFTTGGTLTYSPLVNLTNRLTIGYDFSLQETRSVRPFGFLAFPQGGLDNQTNGRRLLTFDYVGTYTFDVTSAIKSNFSWGGQTVGDERRKVEAWGEGFPGAAVPTVNSAASTLGYEERERTWNAGFFFQNVLDVSDRYFLTLGLRVDGNSTFGSGFGLQMYPKVSGSWVVSDEAFWPSALGSLKVRSAFGKSGRAPDAFDAQRTWENVSIGGNPAFVPDNVGNPDIGPEVTAEFEAGLDGSWLDDRVSVNYTYYRQITSDAILERGQVPSLGFTANRNENIGKVRNSGNEIGLNVSPIRSANLGWDVGVNVATNSSEVLQWIEGDGDAETRLGRPINWSTTTYVLNPDEIGEPVTVTSFYLGQDEPTHIISGNTTVRLPYGISVSARGEYKGGITESINPISISRSVRSPMCFPYYANEENVALQPNLPAIWRARCTPSRGQGYYFDMDYFKLRSVSATLPLDAIFPDRVQSAMLTISFNNGYTWSRSPWGTYAIESAGNEGAGSTGSGIGGSERVPAPTSLRASLRFTF